MIKQYGQTYERFDGGYGGASGAFQPILLPDGSLDYSGGYGQYGGKTTHITNNIAAAPSMMQNIGYGASAIAGLANAYTSYQGLKLAKKQYALGKAATMANYRQNASNYNADIEYRQKQRLANAREANARGSQTVIDFQNVNDYMNQYGANTNMMDYAKGYQSPAEVAAAQNAPPPPGSMAAAIQQFTSPQQNTQVATPQGAAAQQQQTATASTSTMNQQKLKAI